MTNSLQQILTTWTQAGIAVLIALTLLWLLSLRLRDASIIDVFWGFGFVLCNWVTLILIDNEIHPRQWLVHGLVTLWGLRLSIHLLIRNTGKGEDSRYKRWREQGGPRWWLKSAYRIYAFQGVILLVVAAPLILVNSEARQSDLGWLDLFGAGVWLTGFLIEVIADQQLTLFISSKNTADDTLEGKVLDTGLWHYSVHPNYFGDALQWWGIWLIALSVPLGYLSIIGPLLMTLVFMGISNGVLERSLSKRRPGYANYLKRTSHFIPWPPGRPPWALWGSE